VVFPGNLQGRHIRETGPRGAVLVTADETGIVDVQRRIVDVLRWERLEVDLAQAADLAGVVALAGAALADLLSAQPDARPLALRLRLVGRSAAHGELFGSAALLREEMLALGASLGGDRVWIEKVVLATTPMLDAAQIRLRADALADLQAVLAEVGDDAEFLRSLTDDLRGLAGKAPPELSDAVPDFAAIRSGAVGGIVEAVIPGLLARLAQAQ
jgi:hypothetical protein